MILLCSSIDLALALRIKDLTMVLRDTSRVSNESRFEAIARSMKLVAIVDVVDVV